MEPLRRHADPLGSSGPVAIRCAPLGFAVEDAAWRLEVPGAAILPASRLEATGLTELRLVAPSGQAALWSYWDVGEAGFWRFFLVLEGLEGALSLELDAESGSAWRAVSAMGHGARLARGERIVGALVRADDPLEAAALAAWQASAYDRMLDRWAWRASRVDFGGAQRAAVLTGLAELFEGGDAARRDALAEAALRLWGWPDALGGWNAGRWGREPAPRAARALAALVEAGAIEGSELRAALEAGCALEDPDAPGPAEPERLAETPPESAGYLEAVEAVWRGGSYLSARRGLDRWLLAVQAGAPAFAPEALAHGLWLAARIHRQAPASVRLAPEAYGEG